MASEDKSESPDAERQASQEQSKAVPSNGETKTVKPSLDNSTELDFNGRDAADDAPLNGNAMADSEKPANGKKRKSEDRDDSENRDDGFLNGSAKRIPKLNDNGNHVDSAESEGSAQAEMDNAERYWNRDPLSPLRDDDRQRWPGFREVETDADAFESMLRQLGAGGLAVRHVFGLDIEDLLTLPQPIVGFLFCFRHRSDDETTQVDSCPDDIWFANQTHRWLCGSNSLVNIILNIPDLSLGDHLEAFKDFTMKFTPAQRGEAVGNWDFLRQVHNSGLRKMEILLGDVALVEEYKNRKQARKLAPSEAISAKGQTKGKGQGKSKVKASPKKKATAEQDEIDEDAAYHYAAYLPIQGNVWKLDGLDRQPSKLDSCTDDTWLQIAAKILFDRINEVEDEASASILAICRQDDNLKPLQRELAATIVQLNELQQSPASSDEPHAKVENEWLDGRIRGPSRELGVTQYDLDKASEIPEEVSNCIQNGDCGKLQTLQDAIIADQRRLSANIHDEQKSRSAEEEKLELARHDFEPLVRIWLDMLANKEGVLRDLVESVK